MPPFLKVTHLEGENPVTCQDGKKKNPTFFLIIQKVFCNQIIELQARNFIFKLHITVGAVCPEESLIH